MNSRNLIKINLKTIGYSNIGKLSIVESIKDINFSIKRIYYVYEVPKGTIRGHHAHKELNQLLISLNGRIKVILDNGQEKTALILNNPSQGLYVGKGIWRTMEWLDDNAILLVLASEYYDENDYIRDYNEFMKMVKEGYWLENQTKDKDLIEHETYKRYLNKKERGIEIKIDPEKLTIFQKNHNIHLNSIGEILNP